MSKEMTVPRECGLDLYTKVSIQEKAPADLYPGTWYAKEGIFSVASPYKLLFHLRERVHLSPLSTEGNKKRKQPHRTTPLSEAAQLWAFSVLTSGW